MDVNVDFFRGRVDTIILRVLQEQDRYVYEILDLIYKNSVSHYEIKQSTLYNSMKRLESLGLVDSYEGSETNGAKRKYYSLTEKGKELIKKEKEEWEYTRTLLDKLVSDKKIDLTNVTPPFVASALKPLTPRSRHSLEENSEFGVSDNPEITKTPNLQETNSTIDNRENLADKSVTAIETSDSIKAREKASEILGLGEYAPIPVNLENKDSSSNESLPTLATLGTPQETYSESRINYREALSSLFDDKSEKVSEGEALTNNFFDSSDSDDHPTVSHHFNDMKQILNNEGYKIKIYSKANDSNFYYMNFFYSTKLIRDVTLLTYILLFVGLLFFSIITREMTYWVLWGVSIIIPIFSLWFWKQNPNKRIRTKNKTHFFLIASFVSYAILASIVFIISNHYKIHNQTYPAYVFLFSLPLYSIIYNALYRSKRYHLKK